MGSLYIGPVEIQLSGTGFSHFVTTRDFGPFLYERDTESCIELTFVSSDDSRLQKYEFCYRRHDLNFVSDGRHAYAWISGDVSGFLACLELALFVGVNQIGGVLVHASAGVLDGLSWLMPGPSGTGKSTAINGGFDKILSDERVIISRHQNEYRVWGTPFWSDGRQWPLDASSNPIAGVIKLVKSKTTSRRPFSTINMVEWVMRSIVMYGDSAPDTGHIMAFIVDMVESIECIQVSFPKEGSWASSTLSQIGLAS